MDRHSLWWDHWGLLHWSEHIRTFYTMHLGPCASLRTGGGCEVQNPPRPLDMPTWQDAPFLNGAPLNQKP